MVCDQRRQDFIDCMFMHSKCVQSGAYTFDECLKRDAKENLIHEECKRKWTEWMQCRRASIDPRSRFRGNREL